MRKIIVFFITFSCYLLKSINGNIVTKGVLWHVKPYIYVNEETNRTEGIIIDAYNYIKLGCRDMNNNVVENLQHTLEVKTLTDFDNLLEGPDDYGNGNLSNLLRGSTVWIPAVKEYDAKILKNRSVIDKTLFYSPHVAVIVQRAKISLFHKLALGIYDTRHILIISIICAIIFAILIWIAERWNNPEFGKTFFFGFGTGLWWAFVTMTTVGYGDIVPRSFVGRCITVAWMIIGLVSASLMTAAVSNVVLGVDYLELREEKIASIASSYEAHAFVNNFRSNIVDCNSYEEILNKVQAGEVFAGIIPSDIAGYLTNDFHDKKLAIPILIKIEVPVKVMEPLDLYRQDSRYMSCEDTYLQAGFDTAIRKYRKYVQTETLYIETLEDFFRQNDHMMMYYSIAIAALVGVGLIYDMVFCGIMFHKKRKTKGNKALVIGNNKTELKELSTVQNGNNNGLWRNGELQKMRQDITAIKDNITKINAMTKYKKTCNMCAWQR